MWDPQIQLKYKYSRLLACNTWEMFPYHFKDADFLDVNGTDHWILELPTTSSTGPCLKPTL
jgi:hypothetical protein